MTPDAAAALEGIYRDLDSELNRINPVCRSSGNCCQFTKAGHELWTTPLEYDYLMERESTDGRAFKQGVCPFLTPDLKCGVRHHRMLGCRIYFCDPAYAAQMPVVFEKYHARVKAAMNGQGIGYGYFRFMDRIRERFNAAPAPPPARDPS